ncbi:MAG: DEAD/DEAH box helicase [Desulfobulbaceae bacterium]|nr:DEAD/DEAH box helicase [Desulfobulbaceae bacterium]
MSFAQLGLRAELLQAVKTKGYTTPTPIQAKTIPVILAGRDILARAQTGTGKTDAFALALVEILSRTKSSDRHPRALVLTPTRELALQVGESIKAYARRLSLRCTVVHGGVLLNPQIERLKRGIDILVATPGRLLDLADQRHLKLSRVEFLVFDEADRMLDLGFSEEIGAVLDLVPELRRTVLFSATYTQPIRELAARMLQNPAYIEVTPNNAAAESVVQKVYLVERLNKKALLSHLISKGNWSRILIFTRTRYGAEELSEKLTAQGTPAVALHGNKSQSFRTRTLAEFKAGEIRILIATDLAARGLDISNLPYVVNYDLPKIPEDYIHRIGRTGRAGESGLAVSLVCSEEKPYLQAIEELLRQKIPVATVAGFTEGNDIPDYVLFRPGNAASEKKADKEIKQLLTERAAAKLRAQAAGGGKGRGPEAPAKPRLGRSNPPPGQKPAGAGSQPAASARKPKGKK